MRKDWISIIDGCKRGIDLLESAMPGGGDMSTRRARKEKGRKLLSRYYSMIGESVPDWCREEIRSIENRILALPVGF